MEGEHFCLLDDMSLSNKEYILITEQFNLKHGVELLNHGLKFYEFLGPITNFCKSDG
jgi:hypothetical protein